jgi:hypothetical protein
VQLLEMTDLATRIDLHRIKQVDRRHELFFVLGFRGFQKIVGIDGTRYQELGERLTGTVEMTS